MSEKLGRLSRLEIYGYKSIKSLDIELEPLNILIGANGGGKSNFIGFFKFMKKILDKDLEIYTAQQKGADKILHFGKKKTKELSFVLYFEPNAYFATLVPNISDKFVFQNEAVGFFAESINYSGGTKTVYLESRGNKESSLPDTSDSPSIEWHVVSYLKDWKLYHFHDTSESAKVKQTCNINDNKILSPDASNLSAFLYAIKLHSPKSYKKIVKTIQRVAPFFHDFILEPEIHNSDTIRLKWKHKGTDDYFDANDLSDGILRFICLTTLLLQPNLPTIILLDEPELGLHPFALKILASMFRVVSKKTQIIASTQSATFTDEFEVEDIIVVDRVDNHSEFRRLHEEDYKEWLEEYSLGEIWQKNLIGGVPSYD
jgi:predicted ATPase